MNDDRTSCLSNRKPAKRIYGTDLSWKRSDFNLVITALRLDGILLFDEFLSDSPEHAGCVTTGS